MRSAVSSQAVPKPPQNNDLPRLTILRGIATLAVFCSHAFGLLLLTNDAANRTLIQIFTGAGEGAVTCFFVLSGFILCWVARPGESWDTFVWRRASRLWPNHLATWIIGLFLMLAAGRAFNIFALGPSLTLTQVWFPQPAVLEGTNGPAWTLACELFFALLFPTLYRRLLRMSDRSVARAAWVTAGVMIAWTVIVALLVPSEPKTQDGLPVSILQTYAIVFIPIVRLLDFWLGMTLAALILRGRWPAVPGAIVYGASALAFAACVALPAPLGYVAPWLPAIALVVGYSATPSGSAAAARNGLFRRGLLWMGDLSFAFYMIHWLVLQYLQGPLGIKTGTLTPVQTAAYILVCLALSLITALWLRRWVEIPVAKWMRRQPVPWRQPAPWKRRRGSGDPLEGLAHDVAAKLGTMAPATAGLTPDLSPDLGIDPSRDDRASSDVPFADRAGTRD